MAKLIEEPAIENEEAKQLTTTEDMKIHAITET